MVKGFIAACAVGASASAGYLVAARRAEKVPLPLPEVMVVTVYRHQEPPEPPPGEGLVEDLVVPSLQEAKRIRVGPSAEAGLPGPAVGPPVPLAELMPEAAQLGFTGPDALVARAMAAAERGDYRRAWRSLDKALKKNPDHALGHLLAGVLAHVQGDLHRARQEYGEYLLREPLGPRATEVRKVLAATAGASQRRSPSVATR
ncbi:MAG TPA: tetratricopeptide repeat protein [Myxococcales bacterium]|nr:tetratricopeptide repeat protein [Myxococcales bacterium]